MKIFPQLNMNLSEKLEIFGLFCILTIILACAYISNDSPIAVISAVCGVLYTFIAGKGRVICYMFGLCGSGFYAYLAFKNGLYGNFLLYLCFYVPMQIIGIFKWRKHLNKAANVIVKTSLKKKEHLVLGGISVLLSAAVIYALSLSGGANPFVDGVTFTLSVIGMYLTVRRAIEQWILWMIVNFLSICLWINLLLCGERVFSTVIMWSVYFFLAVYFYIRWKNELKSEQNNRGLGA